MGSNRRTNTVLAGEALKLSRDLARQPTAQLLRIINRHPPQIVELVLGTVTADHRAKYGLALNEAGRLIMLATAATETKPNVTERAPLSVSELAKMVNRSRSVLQPQIGSSYRFIPGYGKPLAPHHIAAAWERVQGATDRMQLVRRTPDLQMAEVSAIGHAGEFDNYTIERNKKHAARLLAAVVAPAPHNDKIRWVTRIAQIHTSLEIAYPEMADGRGDMEPVLIERHFFAEADELGATMGNFLRPNDRLTSPGRTISLSSATVFTTDAELAIQLLDGIDLAIGSSVALHGDAAVVATDYISCQDASMVAPAYTQFLVNQRLSSY